MPDSVDKKELGGLARSIDSLFSERRKASTESDSEDRIATGALESPAGGSESGVDAPEGRADPLEPDPFAVVDPATRSAPAPPEPSREEEPPRLPSAPLPPPTSTPPPLPVEAERETEARGAAEERPSARADEHDPAPAPEARDRGEDPGPPPVELAVASFLAGGRDAARVRSLCEGHVAAGEFDPVAAAVERLVLGAGSAPDREILDLARELMSPIVRARLVLRMGQERDESRRGDYQTICRTLGAEMAEAIRDRMADETDRSARRTYFDALVATWDVSRPVVEAMAEDENRFLARNGVAILGTVGGERSADLVVRVLRETTDPLVRREALHAMARLEVHEADALVLKALEDEDEKVRLAAVDAAGELRLERAVRPLSALLDAERDPGVIASILLALGRIGDPGAVPALEKRASSGLFGRTPTEVRVAAYQALAQIGTPHARRLLNRAADDKDPDVKSVARDLLHMR